MQCSYQHVRLMPSDDLAKNITDSFLEDYIADTKHTETKKLEKMETKDTDDLYEIVFGNDIDTDRDEDLQPIGTARTMLGTKVTVESVIL